MADESKVLSTEEVNALSKVAEEKTGDLTELVSSSEKKAGEGETESNHEVNNRALANVNELARDECEKSIASFLRKKIILKSKASHFAKLSEVLNGKTEKHVYSVFRMLPSNRYGIVVIDLPLLHQAINILFGGQANPKDTIIETPGKIGTIVAERLAQVGMEGFAQACKEYGVVNFEHIKTVVLPNLISKLSMDDRVYAMELIVAFGEIETNMTIVVAEEFLQEFIPINIIDVTYIDSDSWRSAIESQVVDSYVTVSVALSEVPIKAKELLELKDGDLIPIDDPTAVFVCLNNVKLFSGSAGQANANRVVKIVNEI